MRWTLGALAFLVLAATGSRASAQLPPGEDDEDDPALARRMPGPSPPPAAPTGPAYPAEPPAGPTGPEHAGAPPGAFARPDGVPAGAERPDPDAQVEATRPVAEPAEAAGATQPHPRLKLSLGTFAFIRPGAVDPASTTGAAQQETFRSVMLDLYPASDVFRLGVRSQVGWETSASMGGGDYLIAESLTAGLQAPGRVTPFVEGVAGVGYMRRMQFGSAADTGYWQLGVEGGAEIYLTGRAYLSLAAGYLHAVNALPRLENNGRNVGVATVYLDTWCLKLGLGI